MEDEEEAMKNLLSIENPGIEDLLRCFFGLKMHEIDAFMVLKVSGKVTGEQLAEILKKDKSGVHRTLQTLLLRGLVNREYRLLRSGGYIYLYSTLPADRMKEIASSKLQLWYDTISGVIEKFDD
jgi:predicted transcriptional regulator